MDPFNLPGTDPDGLPPLTPQPEEEANQANRAGELLGATGEGAGLIDDVVESVSGAASATVDAIGSVASGAAEMVGGAAEAVGGVAEGLGGAAEGVGSAVGAAAEGCGSCSLALLVMLASVGAAVAAVLR